MSEPRSVDSPLEQLRTFLLRPGIPPALLWVGAGASAAAGYPTLAGLAAALRPSFSTPPADDFAVVDAYVEQYGKGNLSAKLHGLLGGPRPFVPLHEGIARLAGARVFRSVVTTNYDRLLEEALTAAQIPHVVQQLEANLEAGALEQVQLHKIHGDLGSWRDVVLTTASYAAFESAHPLVLKFLDLALRQRTVVFVGCSMTDPRLLDWLRGLSEGERSGLHASRAVLTASEWGRLDGGQHELLKSANVRPVLVEDHAAVTTLFAGLAAALAPPERGEMVLTLEPGEPEWTVTGPTAAQPVHRAPSPWKDKELTRVLLALRAVASVGVKVGDPALPAHKAACAALAREVGERLTALLLSPAAQQEVRRRIAGHGKHGRPRLTIRVEGEEPADDRALALPWELLLPGEGGAFPVRDGELDLAREALAHAELEMPGLPEPTGPLTVAVTISLPATPGDSGDSAGLRVEEEAFRLQQALAPLGQTVAFAELGELDDLVEVTAGRKATAVHFSGHGLPGELLFEDELGFPAPVKVGEVVAQLKRALPGSFPRLFFLSNCHGATGGGTAPSPAGAFPARDGERSDLAAALGEGPSTAAVLHRRGFPLVIGYFGPVGDALATRTEEVFYGELARGKSALQAAMKARGAMGETLESDGARFRYPLGWTQLAVYLRGADRPLAQKPSGKGGALPRRFGRREVDLSGLPVLEDGFIGRRQLLHDVRRRVEKNGQRLLVLQGLGGLGKTALASQLLARVFAKENPADALILRCREVGEGGADPIAALRTQAEQHGRDHGLPQWGDRLAVLTEKHPDPAKGFAAVIREIRKERPGLVLYADNAETLQEGPKTKEPGAQGRWRPEAEGWWREMEALAGDGLLVLVSTRYDWEGLDREALVPVPPLVAAEVLRMIDTFPPLAKLGREVKGKLARKVDGHPRTVELLSGVIRKEQASGRRIEDEWRDLVEPLLEKRRTALLDSDLLLGVLWEGLSEAGRAHAKVASVLRVPAPVQVHERLGEGFEELRRATLLTLYREAVLTAEGWRAEDRWGMQSLVREFVEPHVTEEERSAAHAKAGAAYEEWVTMEGARWSDQVEGIHHFHTIGEGDRAWPKVEKYVLWLRGAARYREAQELLESCEAAGATGDRLALTLMYLHQVRRSRGERGNELHGLLERALGLASEEENRGYLLHEIGGLLSEQARYGEAEELLRQSLMVKEKTLGRDHPTYGTSLHELAVVLTNQGRYGEAEELLRQSLIVTEKRLGGDHPLLYPTLANLGAVLAEQGRGAEGENHLSRAVELALAAHGPRHPEVAQLLGLQAQLQLQLGKPEAVETARQAAETYLDTLGPDHPLTQKILPVLQQIVTAAADPGSRLIAKARAASERGDLAAAISAQEEAMALARQAGEGRKALVAVSIVLYNLAGYYRRAGRLDDAVRAFEEVVALDERTGHEDLESDRAALEQARQLAALSPEERQAVAAATQTQQLSKSIAAVAAAALRGEIEPEPFLEQLKKLLAQIPPEADSPLADLGAFVRAVHARLAGEPVPPVPETFAALWDEVEGAAREGKPEGDAARE